MMPGKGAHYFARGPCREPRNRADWTCTADIEIETPRQACQDEYGFCRRKACPDTGVRSGTKRDESSRGTFNVAAREETLRIKTIGMAPVDLVPVQRPGCDHDKRPPPYPAPADERLSQSYPRNEGYRRIKAQCLLKNRARVGHSARVLEGHITPFSNLFGLRSQPLHDIRTRGENIEGPGQRAGRRLVTGKKEHTQLVDELLPAEPFIGLLIARTHDRSSNVIRTVMPVNKSSEMPADPGTGSKNVRLLRNLFPGRIHYKAKYPYLGHMALEYEEIVENVPGNRRIQRHGKNCPANNVCSQMAQCKVKGKRLPRSSQPVEVALMIHQRSPHCPESKRKSHMGKGRVDHGALPAPLLTIADKDRLSNQRLKRSNHEITLGKNSLTVFQDLAHGNRIIEEDYRAPRVSKRSGRHAVSRFRQERQKITLPLPKRPQECGDRPERPRTRRIDVTDLSARQRLRLCSNHMPDI